MRRVAAMALVFSVTCIGQGQASILTRHGITWKFSQSVVCGTYANGDYWVQSPVTITGITPAPVRRPAENGSMLDPTFTDDDRQGYGAAVVFGVQTYDEQLNASRVLPLTVVAPRGSYRSLVSTDTIPNYPGIGSMVRVAAVLTVVDSPPAAPCFRPWPYGPRKQHPMHGRLASQIQWERLVRTFPASHASNIATMAARYEKLQLQGMNQDIGQLLRPIEAMDAYGAESVYQNGDAMLALCADVPFSQKAALVKAWIQYGIDQYGAVRNRWWCNSGHGNGFKLPILFAGQLLDDTSAGGMLDLETACANSWTAPGVAQAPWGAYWGVDRRTQCFVFAEDQQTFWVQETPPGSGIVNHGHGSYSLADVGRPDWGNWHYTDPSNDDSRWAASSSNGYRFCCSANRWHGQVLGLHAMGLQRAWDHDALFAYQNRYVSELAALGYQGWELDYHGRHIGEALRAHQGKVPSVRVIGLPEVGRPFLEVRGPATASATWVFRIHAGKVGAYPGFLLRCTDLKKNPSRSSFGAQIEGLGLVDETTFQFSLPFTTNANGWCDFTMPNLGEPADTTYALQAVLMMPSLTPTNALQVKLQ